MKSKEEKIKDWLWKVNPTNLYTHNEKVKEKFVDNGIGFHPTKERWFSSYHLKHICEITIGEYTSNDEIKSAAILIGLKTRKHKNPNSPNIDIQLW